MKKILVIGSINMDITTVTSRMPKIGETIVGESFSTQPGGKGANQAVAIAKLGGNVKFFGALGNDLYGKRLAENLSSNNVEFCGVVIEDIPSGTAVITVVEGDNCIILNPGANDCVTPDMIKKNEKLFEEADYVLMQLEIPVESVLTAAKLAKAHGCTVIVNPAPYKELPGEIYDYIDMIVPNEHEAESMTGIYPEDEESCKKAIEALLSKGIKSAAVTLGSKGSVYSMNGSLVFTPAKKVKAVDTTAAGDTFIGGMLTYLSMDKTMEEAVKFGTAASAITVTRLGAADSIPSAEEVRI
ncbi:MAG: ribokinase [Clostridia bacterium]|nr:ribokinase [Clostridia bacterium]